MTMSPASVRDDNVLGRPRANSGRRLRAARLALVVVAIVGLSAAATGSSRTKALGPTQVDLAPNSAVAASGDSSRPANLNSGRPADVTSAIPVPTSTPQAVPAPHANVEPASTSSTPVPSRPTVTATAAQHKPVPAAPVAPGKQAATVPAAVVPDVPVKANCATAPAGYARCLSVERTDVPTSADAASPATLPWGLGPSDLASAYKLDTTRGTGQTVAIVDAYDNPNAESGLATYRAMYGLPACTTANGCFRKVNQSGAASPLPVANSSWAPEIALDIQMVSAVCPLCHILLVEATDSGMSNLGTSVNTAVAMGARFVSNSYGAGDDSWVTWADQYYNHPGTVITASTGDSGYGSAYPASSPYVTAVGGTTLTRNASSRGWGESAWSGAGSGCSLYETRPAVQASVDTGCTKRAVADVSAVANPSTGVAVYDDGWTVYGGTSVSSPIIASVYALAGTPGASDLANAYPYANLGGLFDITAGSNGSCPTTQWCNSRTGWDGPTGLGTPNGLTSFMVPSSGLSASIAVSGTPVAGLPTSVTLTPTMPTGRSVASTQWTASRTDCIFSAATSLTTNVTCAGSSAASVTVTGAFTDNLGNRTSADAILTFDTSVQRAVSVTLTGPSGGASPQQVCANVPAPAQATVTDVATSLPIYGLGVSFTRQYNGSSAVAFTTTQTNAAGTVASSLAVASSATVAATTTAVTSYASATVNLDYAVNTCTSALTPAISASAITAGGGVWASGSVHAQSPSQGTVPLSGAAIAVVAQYASGSYYLGTAYSGSDGQFATLVYPPQTGEITLCVQAASGWTSTTASAGVLTVSAAATPPPPAPSTPAPPPPPPPAPPAPASGTQLTGSLSAATVRPGGTVGAQGQLLWIANGSSSPIRGVTVTIVASNGRRLATAKVATNGTWRTSFRPGGSMAVRVTFSGARGMPGATSSLGTVIVAKPAPAKRATPKKAPKKAVTKKVAPRKSTHR